VVLTVVLLVKHSPIFHSKLYAIKRSADIKIKGIAPSLVKIMFHRGFERIFFSGKKFLPFSWDAVMVLKSSVRCMGVIYGDICKKMMGANGFGPVLATHTHTHTHKSNII